MKATGIIRRIDDFGRIAIPKEIRRTMRIREGDSLELYTTNDGGILLQRWNPFGIMIDFAQQAAETVRDLCGHPTVIVDRDGEVIASAGARKGYIDTDMRDVLENAYRGSRLDRHVTIGGGGFSGNEYGTVVFEPIKESGKSIGAVIVLKKLDEQISDIDVTASLMTAQTIAAFLTNSISE